jgi:nicotinic acid mononucleotide adenylyltransferase
MMKKIGIYINAFDPISQADLNFARAAIDQTDLDRVYFLAEPRPRYNQGVKAYEHRNHMVILAVKSDPRLGTIILRPQLASPAEIANVISRRFFSQPLTIVLPEDRLTKLDSWAWLKLDNQPFDLTVGLDKWAVGELDKQINTIKVVLAAKLNYASFDSVSPNKLAISIRHKLRQGHRPAEVSDAVYDYIAQKKLYSSRPKA